MSTIPAWAVRGAKVVCVDVDPIPGMQWTYPEEQPQLGTIYTITGTWTGMRGVTVCGLREISRARGSRERGFQIGYGLFRFRPAVEPKTLAEDVALFKTHLAQPVVTTTRERADA